VRVYVCGEGGKHRQPRGFGFIEFFDERDAADAQYKMDNTTVLGRTVTVVFAQETRKAPDIMREREIGGRGGSGGPRGGCAWLRLDRLCTAQVRCQASGLPSVYAHHDVYHASHTCAPSAQIRLVAVAEASFVCWPYARRRRPWRRWRQLRTS
jgi:hypothetical protein